MARVHPAVLVAMLVVCAAPFCATSLAAPPRDALTGASARAFTAFRTSVRRASSLHAKGLRSTAADVKARRITPVAAFQYHAAALTHLSDEADRFADRAATAFLADAAAAMSRHSDVALRGAVPGDGGSLDRFPKLVRAELERARSGAEARVRTLRRALVKAAGGSSQMRTVVPPWTFDLPGVPVAAGTIVPGGEEPPRLRAITAMHFIDGRLLFAAAGTAAPELSGQFEFWLRSATFVDTAGPTLAEGGVTVSDAGRWAISVELGNPFQGGVPLAGNRVVQFATEPVDSGPAGRQPTRFVHAGSFGLP